MPDQNIISAEGEVIEALPNTMFRVKVDEHAPDAIKEKTLLCTLAGKMRRYRISVMPGDRVKLDVSPYDFSRGRITYRVRE